MGGHSRTVELAALWGGLCSLVLITILTGVHYSHCCTIPDEPPNILAYIIVGSIVIRFHMGVVLYSYDDQIFDAIKARGAATVRFTFFTQVALLVGAECALALSVLFGVRSSYYVIVTMIVTAFAFWMFLIWQLLANVNSVTKAIETEVASQKGSSIRPSTYVVAIILDVLLLIAAIAILIDKNVLNGDAQAGALVGVAYIVFVSSMIHVYLPPIKNYFKHTMSSLS